MRLTALCICGTVLACLSLSWTTADSDEGDILGDHGFGPCIATLRPEWPCRQGQDESTCPYLFSLPPLTFQLPKHLRELEKIVMDLQKLKDNVDQLRRMCADCTVSQTERECERQKEIEHEKLSEDADRLKDERNWLNERTFERPKVFGKEGGTDRVKAEKTMAGNGDSDSEKRVILEERGKKKLEAERGSNKGVVKENERNKNVKEMAEKDGKTMTEVAKGNDKSGQAKVPISGGNERTVDVRKKPVEKNNRDTETDRDKDYDGKGDSNGDPEDTMENGKDKKSTSNGKNKEKTEESDHHIWRGETKETEKKTRTEEERGSDEIKMSEGHDEHTNKEREQQGTEREKEMEKGIKVERNNEKSKQAESIGRAEKERTIKEREDKETGTEIKTDGEKTAQSVQRDSDGELVSSKATESTDFVSISSTPHSIISLAPGHDSMDSTKAITFTSSLPSPSLSSSTSHSITKVSQRTITVADTLPTQSTYPGPAGISEHPSSDVEEDFRTTAKAPINTLGGPGQQITSPTSRFTSATSAKPGAGFPGHVSSTTTTTTPLQHFYTTTFPGVTDRSRWTEKKNITSNKAGVKQLPGRGPKPGEKHKPAIKPEADQKLKNPKNDRKHDQKQQPPHQKSTTNKKSKPGKHSKVQMPKPDQTPQLDHLPTDQSLKINQIPKQDQEHATDQRQLRTEKPKSHQKATPPAQRQTVNTTGSDEDLRMGREPESVEIPAITQNSKPENNLVHPFKTNKPDQTQKAHNKLKSDEKTKPDQRLTLNPYLTPVQQPEPESETTNLMPRPSQKPKIELMENSDENPLPKPKSVKDSTPGQTLTPDRALTRLPDQKSNLSQKVPKINQKPKPNQKHPVVVTGQKTKAKVKPKPDQTPQTNVRTPLPDQISNLNPESLPDEISEAVTNKPSKPKAPSRRRPTVRPGEPPVQRPKPAVQQQPSSKTDLDPLQISGTTSDDIQHSQTDVPPAPGPVTQIAEVSHFPGDTEFRPSTMKSITLGPKTSNSLETGPVPRLHTLSKGFSVSPNSRITSDLRPQTAGQEPSIPVTTRPNKIIRGILPSVIPSISPGSTKPSQASNTDSSLQAEILHNMEETEPRQTPDPDTMMIPVLTLSAQTASTVNPNLRSTTPATSGLESPAVEASTPSARELRVKINQVAAFFNNSLSPKAGPLDRHQKEHTEDNQGDSRPHRPDSKLPPQIPSKVSLARDCADHLLRGKTKSAVYLVTPDLRRRSFPVLCDMELDGGGWTLLQQRLDGSVSFNRTWADYRSGFGELDGGEFWLGNNMIHLLTRDRDVVLRVELEDFDGVMEYAEYKQFRVASERMRYRLTVGGYSGTAGDALRFSKSYDHNNRAFTTPDRDHDQYPSGNCGAYYSSGWWFDACMAANLNGRYYVGRYKGVRDGIFWGTWQNISAEYYPTNDRQSFKTVRMMIRPKGFAP